LLAPTMQSFNRFGTCKSTALKQLRSAQRIQSKFSGVVSPPEAEVLINTNNIEASIGCKPFLGILCMLGGSMMLESSTWLSTDACNSRNWDGGSREVGEARPGAKWT
jgi:hypothetical protein